MVTWGVTDAGGRLAGTHSEGEAAGDDSAAPHAGRRAQSVVEATPTGAGAPHTVADGREEHRDGGLPPITVEPTPAGLATALSHASAGLTTTGPPRSHPAYRRSPPAFTVGERTRVPARVRAATPDVDVVLELPPSLSALFVAAPLAYYLPASIRASDRATPRLFVEGEPRVTLDDLEDDAARLLRRVFHLDCLVRDGPSAIDQSSGADRSAGLLASLGLNPASLRSSSPERRLDRYLSASEPRAESALPDWHLSTAVEATAETIPCLPSLLSRLSLIDRPDGEPRGRADLLDRTLSTAYRTRGDAAPGDVLAPNASAGRFRGWLAPGRPLEAFKPTGAAFEHRRRYGTGRDGSLSVAVVLADPAMIEEGERVADVYEDSDVHSGNSSLSVEVTRAPTRATLRGAFQRGHDVLHYVGHCDDAGLRCADGHLAAADLPACHAPTFFLNACGSYDEGLGLIERGAVAGAVTFADVLDRHAARVGTAFAHLLVSGYSVQRALQLARRRILMGQDYAVVGDGTYAPWADERPPGVFHVEAADDRDGNADEEVDEFRVTYEVVTVRATGERYPAPFGDADLLNGDAVTTTLSREAVGEVLERRSRPVIFEGDLYWSSGLRERLGA